MWWWFPSLYFPSLPCLFSPDPSSSSSSYPPLSLSSQISAILSPFLILFPSFYSHRLPNYLKPLVYLRAHSAHRWSYRRSEKGRKERRKDESLAVAFKPFHKQSNMTPDTGDADDDAYADSWAGLPYTHTTEGKKVVKETC